MIAIDNAVELTIKTYLGLPRRITGLQLSRKEFGEISESFPALLNGIERHASERLAGVDLGEIEWFHQLRNELYHQGNGLTVERDKVDVYAHLANVLFKNLFGIELVHPIELSDRLLDDFLGEWIELERCVIDWANSQSVNRERSVNPVEATRILRSTKQLTQAAIREFDKLRRLRNEIVHGIVQHRDALSPEVVARVRALRENVASLMRAT